MEKIYDMIIIGGGPAGLSAGIYGGRAKLDVLVIEKENKGGQISLTSEVVNYPGILEISGTELMTQTRKQAEGFGVNFVQGEVVDMDFTKDIKTIKTKDAEYSALSVVIATGAAPRKLGFPGEQEFTGRGVAYCATCDGDFFDGLEVFVVGGGNSAVEEALFLTKFARKVTIIHFEEDIHCEKITAEKARNHPQIEIRTETVVLEAIGDGILEAIKFKNVATGEEYVVEADEEDGTMGLFFFIGYVPQTKLFEGKVELTEGGYVKAGEDTKTNVEGVYVAGDCRQKEIRQVVTAVCDGAVAAITAEKYIAEKFE